MGKYSNVSKKDLIERIEELEYLLNVLKEEKDQEELLKFPWLGNLGHWYWNVKTNKVVCNDKKVLTLNYTKDEIPQNMGFEFFTSKLHPEDYEIVMDNMRQHLYGITDAYEVEYRIQAKDGSWKWYYDIGKVTKRDEENKPIIVAGIVFNITEKKEMELLIQEQNRQLLEIVNLDYLTNVLNRRALYEKLKTEIDMLNINKSYLTIVMIDIDNFKLVNDTYGHLVGDLVLKQVAEIIKSNLLESHIVGRYGGEEFLIILPDINKEQGYIIAERIRKSIENAQFVYDIRLTISGGLKEYNKESINMLIDKADKCLYQAKNNGRNQIVCD